MFTERSWAEAAEATERGTPHGQAPGGEGTVHGRLVRSCHQCCLTLIIYPVHQGSEGKYDEDGFLCVQFVYNLQQFLKQTFPVYTFHKQSYEMSCVSVCPVTLKKSAVTDLYLVWRLHLTCSSVIFLIRGDWIRAQLHHHIPPTLSQNSFTKTNDNKN